MDLVTSVDPASMVAPINSLKGLVDGVAAIVAGLLNMGNAGSVAIFGSVDTVIGSVAGL
ncbi:hypothetical protein [Rhodococcus sp. AG1013]|uniref:hypothetical protein n=1 Tax=unclassified Rhodococcus (in: high G+C Gram-positive bacteria) TaxID=192944 RepID=UPI0015F0DD2B|nr:hypothetical protein [Rhodococcus sp. AG1013]